MELIESSDLLHIWRNYFSHSNRIGQYKILPPPPPPPNELSHSIQRIGLPTGYLSQQAILHIKDGADQSIAVFMKFLDPSASKKHAEYVRDLGAFDKEANLYMHILPQLTPLVSIHFAPRSLLTKREAGVLIFENLSITGYSLAVAQQEVALLDAQHICVALKSVAALHAASMIFDRQKPFSKEFGHFLGENAYPPSTTTGSMRARWVQNSIKSLQSMVREMYPKDPTDAIAQRFGEVLTRIVTFCQPSQMFRNVLSHGDLWSNNIMFRYAEFNDGCRRHNDLVPVEAKLLDYQLARYAPPALDVLTLIANSTTSETRRRHMMALLDSYYAELENELLLSGHGLSVHIEYPREMFDRSCRHYHLAGLIESCLFGHLILLPTRFAEKIIGGGSGRSGSPDGFEHFMNENRSELCMEAWRTDEPYRTRMSDMIRDVIDGYVNVE